MLLENDPKTLRKYFHAELERGSVEATAKVAQSLFQIATAGKNVAAAIFWMKARADWREKHEVVVSERSITNMSDKELQRLVDSYADEILAARFQPGALQVIEGVAMEV